jgi:DNA-binding GntR family transcriptional regulator
MIQPSGSSKKANLFIKWSPDPQKTGNGITNGKNKMNKLKTGLTKVSTHGLPNTAGNSHQSLAKSKKSVQTRKLSDLAYDSIKSAIICLDLAPGQEVTEAQLVTRFDYGKASIRNALLRLSQEGLVRALPRRGYEIAPLTLQDIKNIFDVRILLERESVRKAAGKLTQGQIERIKKLNKVRYHPGNSESVNQFLMANQAIHVLIAEASGNEKLAGLVANIFDDMTRAIHFGLLNSDSSKVIQHGHHEILEALVAGNAEEAERLVLAEVENFRKLILLVAMQSPALNRVNLFK